MTTATNRLTQPSANGTTPRTKKAPAPRKRPAVSPSRLRTPLTVAMGCGIPALSLTLSHIGGELLSGGTGAGYVLGAGALALCGTVLFVSLSHLRDAIADITRSPRNHALALAIAIDAALVVCELARVAGFASLAIPCLMGAVTVASMGLNCWAFLRGSHK